MWLVTFLFFCCMNQKKSKFLEFLDINWFPIMTSIQHSALRKREGLKCHRKIICPSAKQRYFSCKCNPKELHLSCNNHHATLLEIIRLCFLPWKRKNWVHQDDLQLSINITVFSTKTFSLCDEKNLAANFRNPKVNDHPTRTGSRYLLPLWSPRAGCHKLC